MSNLQSYVYPGFGEWGQKNMSYCQAIRVGDRIVCSGQGGWDRGMKELDLATFIKGDLLEEIDQAFENVDYNLKHAGGKGWSQVYRVVTYSTNMRAQSDRIVENFRKWMPNHCPVWTQLGVNQLGADLMHIEIDVEAYDEEGAAEARKAKTKAA